jgi:hypothetical protein
LVNRKASPIKMSCKKEEAVFFDNQIYPSSINGAHDEVLNQIATYFKHISQLNDDRLLVLTAELLLENTVDNYLSQIMPTYKKSLGDNRDFTFSLKIAVAKGLKLSPPRFFNSIDLVREIRNEFVHNLEVKTLDNVKPENINKIKVYLELFEGKTSDRNLQEQFKSLSLYTFLGLNSQIENVRSLNSFLRDTTFLDNLRHFCLERCQDKSSLESLHGEKNNATP